MPKLNKAVIAGEVSRAGSYVTHGETTFTFEMMLVDAPIELQNSPRCLIAIRVNAIPVFDYRTLALLSLVMKGDVLRFEVDGNVADGLIDVDKLHSVTRWLVSFVE